MSGMRTYGQNCGVARALDLLGERWTILIVRELARGPKRFGDLAGALEGIGTNLLAARLKSLSRAGVIEPRLDPVPAYALTERGEQLVPVLEDLALWGAGLAWPDTDGAASRAAWAAMTMRANMDRSERPAPDGLYEFDVEGERFWLRVNGRSTQLRDGPAPVEPDARMSADRGSFLRVATGRRRPGGRGVTVDGDGERLEGLLETFRLPAAVVERFPA